MNKVWLLSQCYSLPGDSSFVIYADYEDAKKAYLASRSDDIEGVDDIDDEDCWREGGDASFMWYWFDNGDCSWETTLQEMKVVMPALCRNE